MPEISELKMQLKKNKSSLEEIWKNKKDRCEEYLVKYFKGKTGITMLTGLIRIALHYVDSYLYRDNCDLEKSFSLIVTQNIKDILGSTFSDNEERKLLRLIFSNPFFLLKLNISSLHSSFRKALEGLSYKFITTVKPETISFPTISQIKNNDEYVIEREVDFFPGENFCYNMDYFMFCKKNQEREAIFCKIVSFKRTGKSNYSFLKEAIFFNTSDCFNEFGDEWDDEIKTAIENSINTDIKSFEENHIKCIELIDFYAENVKKIVNYK